MQKKTLLFFVFVLMLFYSCEYDNDDRNFHNIEKPEQIFTGIDLAGIDSSGIIYIYQPTMLYYTLNTSGKKIIEQTFTVDGKEVSHTTNESQNYIYIDPSVFDDQEHILKLDMQLASGSGSLADALGAERYVGSFEFKLVYVNSTINLNIKQGLTTDGFLELTWDKPTLTHLSIAKYKIYKSNTLVEEIIDLSKTSFVDPSYVYGYQNYTIEVEFNEDIPNKKEYYSVVYSTMDEDNVTIDFLDTEKLQISWTNPNLYACKYVLVWFGGVILDVPKDQVHLTLNYIGFPSPNMGYSLYILPLQADYKDYEDYYNSAIYLGFHTPRFDVYTYNITANKASNTMIGISESNNSVIIYDVNTMLPIRNVNLPYNFSTGTKVFNSESGIAAVDDGNSNIYVYKNANFSEVIQTVKASNDALWNWTLTNNDKIAYYNYNGTFLHDAISGVLLSQVKGYYTISNDGRYLNTYDYPTYRMFKLDDDNTLHKIAESNSISAPQSNSRSFNPLDSSEFYIFTNSTTTVYNSNDFSVKKQLDGVYQDTDLFTGNIILKDSDFSNNKVVHILDSEYHLLASFKVTDNNNLQLINNYLIQANSYLDLSNILEK